MADGCENGCGIVGEFLGIYSMRGETMFEGHGIGGVPITVDWRKKFGYVAPTTEIDYAFSQRYTLKDVSISSFLLIRKPIHFPTIRIFNPHTQSIIY